MSPALASLLSWWADRYGGSAVLSTSVTALHLAGMLLAGGLAVAADRSTLRALRGSRLTSHLDELGSVHRPVLAGLAITMVSGVLMLAADLDALAGSPVFWTKMAVLALLLANGWRLRRAAAACRHGRPGAAPHLGRAARCSAALWFAALVLGAVLPAA
jgi:hypothetical protein